VPSAEDKALIHQHFRADYDRFGYPTPAWGRGGDAPAPPSPSPAPPLRCSTGSIGAGSSDHRTVAQGELTSSSAPCVANRGPRTRPFPNEQKIGAPSPWPLITDASNTWSAPVTLVADEIWQARREGVFLSTAATPGPEDGSSPARRRGRADRGRLSDRALPAGRDGTGADRPRGDLMRYLSDPAGLWLAGAPRHRGAGAGPPPNQPPVAARRCGDGLCRDADRHRRSGERQRSGGRALTLLSAVAEFGTADRPAGRDASLHLRRGLHRDGHGRLCGGRSAQAEDAGS
jgi:hypothetical protein